MVITTSQVQHPSENIALHKILHYIMMMAFKKLGKEYSICQALCLVVFTLYTIPSFQGHLDFLIHILQMVKSS
jgi:hypothetical protein